MSILPANLPASTPPRPNHFLRLPLELRCMIYDKVILDPSTPIKIHARRRRPISFDAGLLCTNHQIYAEFSDRISTHFLDRETRLAAYNRNLDFRGLLAVFRKVADKNASSLRAWIDRGEDLSVEISIESTDIDSAKLGQWLGFVEKWDLTVIYHFEKMEDQVREQIFRRMDHLKRGGNVTEAMADLVFGFYASEEMRRRVLAE